MTASASLNEGLRPPFIVGSTRRRTKSTLKRKSASSARVPATAPAAASSIRNRRDTKRLTCGAMRTMRSDTSVAGRVASGDAA